MGQAKRNRQIAIDKMRQVWSKRIPETQREIHDLELELLSLTGDEGYYWELVDHLASLKKGLATDMALSPMTDKDLHSLLRTRGFL